MYVEIEPSDYHVLHPRPAYLIVSMDKNGRLNVMAASWVTPLSEEPFLVGLPIWRESKTYENIRDVREFTINVVSDKHIDIVWKAGTLSGKKVDKWSLLGLKPYPSKNIRVPGIDGVLGFLECRVINSIGVGESELFIAEVLAIHVNKELYEKYGWNLRKTSILMHAGGKAFTVPGRLVFPTIK
ncbi:MAG: flavin reductase family protein [Thermoprotei archaeon]